MLLSWAMGTYELLVLLSQAVGICELGNMGGSVGRLGDMMWVAVWAALVLIAAQAQDN